MKCRAGSLYPGRKTRERNVILCHGNPMLVDRRQTPASLYASFSSSRALHVRTYFGRIQTSTPAGCCSSFEHRAARRCVGARAHSRGQNTTGRGIDHPTRCKAFGSGKERKKGRLGTPFSHSTCSSFDALKPTGSGVAPAYGTSRRRRCPDAPCRGWLLTDTYLELRKVYRLVRPMREHHSPRLDHVSPAEHPREVAFAGLNHPPELVQVVEILSPFRGTPVVGTTTAGGTGQSRAAQRRQKGVTHRRLTDRATMPLDSVEHQSERDTRAGFE